jgi:hypothetical protein
VISFSKRYLRVCLIIAAALVLNSCSGAFYIKPEGSLTQSVQFSFFESPDFQSLSKQEIVQLIVQEKGPSEEWSTIWRLQGKYTGNTIVYGAKYDGLIEEGPAKPLVKSATYRVVAESSMAFAPGHSGALFVIAEDGSVVMSE